MEITKKDLVGEIANFPLEVVERMVFEQIKQGHKPNPAVFAKKKSASDYENGFTWSKTYDGHRFWEEVIRLNDFDSFFKRYPKKYMEDSSQTPDSNLVYAIGVMGNGKKVIEALESHGGINIRGHYGDEPTYLYYIDPETNYIEICGENDYNKPLRKVLKATYTRIEIEDIIIEVSMEDIAEMMGVDVSKIRIKK
jgi:hypothetical protein